MFCFLYPPGIQQVGGQKIFFARGTPTFKTVAPPLAFCIAFCQCSINFRVIGAVLAPPLLGRTSGGGQRSPKGPVTGKIDVDSMYKYAVFDIKPI